MKTVASRNTLSSWACKLRHLRRLWTVRRTTPHGGRCHGLERSRSYEIEPRRLADDKVNTRQHADLSRLALSGTRRSKPILPHHLPSLGALVSTLQSLRASPGCHLRRSRLASLAQVLALGPRRARPTARLPNLPQSAPSSTAHAPTVCSCGPGRACCVRSAVRGAGSIIMPQQGLCGHLRWCSQPSPRRHIDMDVHTQRPRLTCDR